MVGLGDGGLPVPAGTPGLQGRGSEEGCAVTVPRRAGSGSAEPSGPQDPRGWEAQSLPVPLCVP